MQAAAQPQRSVASSECKMENMSLDLLLKATQPPLAPREVGSPDQWAEVEKRIGVRLPRDYKEFIGVFGVGGFNNFIYPFNPFTEHAHLNLINALTEAHETERVKRLNSKDDPTSIVHPFNLFPATDGLLPCGTTSNFGDYFFWQVKSNPEEWKIVFYNLRDGEYELFPTNFIGFITGVLTRNIVSDLISDSSAGNEKAVFS